MYYYTDGNNYLALFEPLQELGAYHQITKEQFDQAMEQIRLEKEAKRKRKIF